MLKYQVVKKQLKKELEGVASDEALPPIRILMKEYGMSLSTITRALKELEKEGLLTRKKGSGIFPRKRSVSGRENEVGIVLHALDQRFYSLLLNGIASELLKFGISVRLFLLESREDPIENALSGIDSASCIIIAPATFDVYNSNLINEIIKLSNSGKQVVCLDIPIPGLSCDFVGLDNESAFYEGVTHLISKGCRKFFVAGNLSSSNYSTRYAGIAKACKKSNAEIAKVFDTNKITGIGDIITKYKASGCDSIISADANWTELLVSFMRNGGGAGMKMTGIVEEGTIINSSENFFVLEKPSIQMGIEAAGMFLNNRQEKQEKQIKILQIKNKHIEKMQAHTK